MKYIVIHHSGVSRETQPNETRHIQGIESAHRRRFNSCDSNGVYTLYHYIVWYNGKIYEKRDINSQSWHTMNNTINRQSIAICIIGNYDTDSISPAQIASVNKILSMYPKLTRLWHRDASPSICPWRNIQMNLFCNKLMMMYKTIYEREFGDMEVWDRIIQYPEKIMDNMKKLPVEQQIEELSYLMCIWFERLNKKKQEIKKAS